MSHPAILDTAEAPVALRPEPTAAQREIAIGTLERWASANRACAAKGSPIGHMHIADAEACEAVVSMLRGVSA